MEKNDALDLEDGFATDTVGMDFVDDLADTDTTSASDSGAKVAHGFDLDLDFLAAHEEEVHDHDESERWVDRKLGEISMESKLVIASTIKRVTSGDQGAPFESEPLNALLALRQTDFPEWIRVRGKLKHGNSRMPITELDRAIKSLRNRTRKVALTHHGYAKDILKRLAAGPHMPVSFSDALYIPCAESRLWIECSLGDLAGKIARLHDAQENCIRFEDYESIAKHAISLATDRTFFEKAPNGVACLQSFYSVQDAAISKEPLGLNHRQKQSLDFEPADMETPLFDAFMHETFCSPVEGEEEGQRRLLEEYSGAAMLGLAPRFQKAFLWLDRYGRAGKGTLQSIYKNLVPECLTTAISPVGWREEYYLARLAGQRLNVVGELAEDKPIPAAEFKSVLGGDMVTGRFPTQRPFSFRNEAMHLFMSNHFIKTNEHSEAFYARWVLVEFPNSRLKSGLPLDSSVAERIIKAELPGIAFKALNGGARLLHQGAFSASAVHDRLMAEWRRTSSSVEEFIHDFCELGESLQVRRASLYRAYVEWCKDNGRMPMAKSRVKDLLEHNIKLGVRLAKLDGHEIFRGLGLKSDLKSVSDLGHGKSAGAGSDEDADF